MEPIANLDSRSGFTLIECCVAVVIMMVALLGLLQAVNISYEHNMGNLLRNEAISVADEQMAKVKTSVFDTASFTALDTAAPTQVDMKVRGGFHNYSVNRTVSTESVASKEVATKEVTIRVTWRYKGDKINHSISSLIIDPRQL